MKRFTVLILFLLASDGWGQMYKWNGDSLPGTVIGRNYLTLGVSWSDVNDLNDRLDQLGISGFSSHSFDLGFGGDLVYGRMITGGEIDFLLWRNNVVDGIEDNLWAGRFVFDGGYQLLNSDRYFLYPVLGLGAGVSSFRVGLDQIPFDSALIIPANDPVYHFSLVIDLGAGFDVMFPSWKNNHQSILGIRAGYMIDPIRSKRWYQNRTEVTGGPDLNLQGFYIKLVLGKGMNWNSKRVQYMKMMRDRRGI